MADIPVAPDVLLDGLIGPVIQAGRLQLEIRQQGLVLDRKADKSPVTQADRESEAILLAALARVAPDLPVVAEEAMAEGREPEIDRWFFLVDPLDGTREYASGGDDFTVNVAMIADGLPVFGVVYAPARSWLLATLGYGHAAEATVEPTSASRTAAEIDWIRLHTRAPIAGQLVAVASKSHRSKEEEAFLAGAGVSSSRYIGSSLKFGLVARGDADVYPRFGSISEWDTAAGHAVLVAAGGVVVTRDGRPWRYGNTAGRFLSPPFIAWGRAPMN